MNFGAWLRHYRTARGLSLGQLAKASGVSKSVIHYIETGGTQSPSLRVAQKLAEALGEPLDAFQRPAPVEPVVTVRVGLDESDARWAQARWGDDNDPTGVRGAVKHSRRVAGGKVIR